MTIEIEDVALARFLEGPAPYGSGERTVVPTAGDELAAALEGQAPRLSRLVFDRLGPAHTAELAQVVRRAVAVGIKRRADRETADRLTGLQDLLVAGLDQVTDGCTTPEVEAERACRVCQCTDEDGCLIHDDGRLTGVCWWVEADLCSECQRKAKTDV